VWSGFTSSPVASANHCEILSRLFIGSFNLVAAQRMSKPPKIRFFEIHPHPPPLPREGEATDAASLLRNTK
jgi:hypothetical protein